MNRNGSCISFQRLAKGHGRATATIDARKASRGVGSSGFRVFGLILRTRKPQTARQSLQKCVDEARMGVQKLQGAERCAKV